MAMIQQTTPASHNPTNEARQLAQRMQQFQTEVGAADLAA